MKMVFEKELKSNDFSEFELSTDELALRPAFVQIITNDTLDCELIGVTVMGSPQSVFKKIKEFETPMKVNWMTFGRCLGQGLNLFFHNKGAEGKIQIIIEGERHDYIAITRRNTEDEDKFQKERNTQNYLNKLFEFTQLYLRFKKRQKKCL